MQKNKHSYTEEYLEVPIDHFSYIETRTFKLRYLVNTQYVKTNDAPIFFCVGEEGGAEYDVSQLGFIWDIAPEFNAALIYVDHRYFGKSLPFGDDSFSNISMIGYLSTEQALADNALLIVHLKEKRLQNLKNSPVILFGYSYGGMMAAWMRIKYPHLTAGAIASSAPVRYFDNVPNINQHSYVDNIMKIFVKNGCPFNSIMGSFDAIRKMANTPNGRKYLNEQYHLSPLSQINNPSDAENLLGELQNVMFYLILSNYPYPAKYFGSIPAYPIKIACKPFASAKTQEQLAIAPFIGLNLLYNTTGEEKDFQLWNFTDDGKIYGWTFLEATQLVFAFCSRGPPFDPFNKTCPFNETFDASSYDSYNSIGYNKDSMYRPHWLMNEYGYEYPTASNIVFSNGDADLWLDGGWRNRNTNIGSIYSLIVKDGTHGYDIREANPLDTQSVKDVRNQEKQHIRNWIHQAKFATNSSEETK
uniref:Uncharacterized protein n=1 Tax=Meloidogyne incognita TaxID=6306 RepID=A0A914MNZ0_MELIC